MADELEKTERPEAPELSAEDQLALDMKKALGEEDLFDDKSDTGTTQPEPESEPEAEPEPDSPADVDMEEAATPPAGSNGQEYETISVTAELETEFAGTTFLDAPEMDPDLQPSPGLAMLSPASSTVIITRSWSISGVSLMCLI